MRIRIRNPAATNIKIQAVKGTAYIFSNYDSGIEVTLSKSASSGHRLVRYGTDCIP
jgi:hypothetical protein